MSIDFVKEFTGTLKEFCHLTVNTYLRTSLILLISAKTFSPDVGSLPLMKGERNTNKLCLNAKRNVNCKSDVIVHVLVSNI